MQKTQDNIDKASLAECQQKISNCNITQKQQQNNNKSSVPHKQFQCKNNNMNDLQEKNLQTSEHKDNQNQQPLNQKEHQTENCNDHQHQNQDLNQSQNQNQNQDEQKEQQSSNKKWKTILPPKKQVKLFMIDFAHCDAKKCSGKKLQRFKLLNQIKDKNKKFKGIVLSAFGKKQTSLEDLQYAEKYGVCVVDCSWNRIQQTRQFRFKHQRKLPFVTAGNPVNYGKPYQLSCAQALATALCTIGYCEQAQYIMSKFGWADGFWSLNPLIQNYSKCKSLQQLKMQSKRIEESGNKTFQRNYDLSDPQSQEDD